MVKTRLAATIGHQKSVKVYRQLLDITRNETSRVNCDKKIYFSDNLEDFGWQSYGKSIQKGRDLGDKMYNAFVEGFAEGYQEIILIGSDLPDLSSDIIENAFLKFKLNEVVFGPAEDGGYYLIGLCAILPFIFKDKPWSQSNLLSVTTQELNQYNVKFSLLEKLNDIDTFEDYKSSSIYQQ